LAFGLLSGSVRKTVVLADFSGFCSGVLAPPSSILRTLATFNGLLVFRNWLLLLALHTVPRAMTGERQAKSRKAIDIDPKPDAAYKR
jgi:hypothetical protein